VDTGSDTVVAMAAVRGNHARGSSQIRENTVKGDLQTVVINRHILTYERHENHEGTHRIASEHARIRVLPDGLTTAKARYALISQALRANQDHKDVILALMDLGLKVERAGRTSDQERVLILLHDGPLCGREVEYMNRYAARICELRQDGWPIEKERCVRHNHRGFQALYYLNGLA
jgi:hypothetical protein